MADNPKFNRLLDEIKTLHNKKNDDYADSNPYSNFEGAARIAGCTVDTVFATLIGIKLERLRVLNSSNKPPNNESIEDSRKDLATYALLWASYHMDDVVSTDVADTGHLPLYYLNHGVSTNVGTPSYSDSQGNIDAIRVRGGVSRNSWDR